MSHHFLCNYRLTLHHDAFRTFCTRSIGWALFGVKFRPLQEIEAIMGGGRIFDTGPFFVRLRYMTKVKWGNSEFDEMVVSFASPWKPFLVTTFSNRKVTCDCLNYSTKSLCAHVLATAQKLGVLQTLLRRLVQGN